MADNTKAGGDIAKHEKALDLAEDAVGAIADGDDKKADGLISKAKKLDPSAPQEVAQDLEEGAGNPDAVKNMK